MTHPLDNPIYSSLSSNHSEFSSGTNSVLYYNPKVSPFAGLKDYKESEFKTLMNNQDNISSFVIFSLVPIEIPIFWKVIRKVEMYQMLYELEEIPSISYKGIIELKNDDVPEMVELVKLTQPGPFRSETIKLGNYAGIFCNGKLAAMAGHRFHPDNYIEISAVCTHPDYTGKGFGRSLMLEQIKRIKDLGQIPFLHVRTDNESAIGLYEKVGFTIRTAMIAYFLQASPEI